MTRALPLLLLALSLPAAATDSESFARRYLAYVHAVGQHSERLWPGWRMADKAFLYSDGRSTWVADAEGRAQRTTAAGDSDPDLDLSYAFPRYRGRPAVLLQISAAHLRSNTGNSETLAAIGPHEAFHRYAQKTGRACASPVAIAATWPRSTRARGNTAMPCSSRCSRPCARPGSATAT